VLNATVVNMRFVKPLDEDCVLEMAATHSLLVTVEDNVIAGGAGSAVSECLAAHNVQIPILHLGLPDRFIEHGSREEMLSDAGLDVPGIQRAIQAFQAHPTQKNAPAAKRALDASTRLHSLAVAGHAAG
jgi:Deoxyxylulose-5-phosphate synthase